ncbi:homeobox protein Pknox1, partial [Thamnocephalis sphaerospora]
RRSNHPQGAVAICRRWLFAHRHHPYPTADEKNELCHQTGLRLSQINDWFVNARRRYLSKGEH